MNVCLAIVGPTASGKTALATELAQQIQAEIICMDSTTVYKGFDIGSSKPSSESQQKVPHHLLDILEPNEPFSAFHFVQEAERCIVEIQSRGKVPLIVGGTYFYLRALQHGMYPKAIIPAELLESIEREYFEEDSYNTARMHADLKQQDPKAAEKIHPNDKYRLVRALAFLKSCSDTLPSEQKAEPLSEGQRSRLWLKYAMLLSRQALTQNISLRTEQMLSQGLVEEARSLLDMFPTARALGSIGYDECVRHLNKQLTEKQLRNEIIEKTRQLAKRQMTWLRSDPQMRFIDTTDIPRIVLDWNNLKYVLEAA